MKKNIFFFIILLNSLPVFSQLSVVNLKCESKENPSGIEATAPVLGWQLYSKSRGILQTAYRIIVADNAAGLAKNEGNIWDSKKINSDASIQIKYAGKKLEPAKTYYWKVQVWDNKNNMAWSKMAMWQMGLPATADWKGAQWIAYEEMDDNLRIVPAQENRGAKELKELTNTLPLLRKIFSIKKPVKKATLFICGLGHFEASINGKKIGDHFLDAGWTNYDKEALYVTFDVSAEIRNGLNALGVMLGNGFYFIPRDRRYRKLTGAFGFPKMICRLAVEYKDGSSDNIISDESWKTVPAPVTFTGIYSGEDYNANLEQQGWNTASFNDKSWRPVIIVKGISQLRAQLAEPLKVHEIFSAKKITKITDSVFVYDLGQNASAIPQVTVRGKKGERIRLIPAELINENGTANQRATGSPHYYDYILKGNGEETWQPRFTYYGFRYVQVERGVPKGEMNPLELPVIIDLKSLHVRNAAKRVGAFASSSDLFNRTGTLINWGIKSNMASVLTDCPHREKLGWLEQVHLMGASVQYNYDVAAYFKKTINDMIAAQTAEGLVPEIVPEYVVFYWGNGVFRDSPEWGSSSIIVPWYLYQWYGDKRVLEQSYPMMQRYLAYLQTKDSSRILSQGLGDWYDLGPARPGFSQLTPKGITATAIYYYDLNILAKIARLLGKQSDALQYDKLAAEVKAAFNKAFFNKEAKQYGTGSQTANAMAVYMKLVEPQYEKDVVENIVKDIRTRNNSLTAGDIGYRYLLKALDDAGRSDVIFDMNSRTDVPGYGYQLAKGATALTESWQALPNVSNNHLMLGHLMEWFYEGLAGIRQSDSSVAYHQIEIRPQVIGDITFAKASYQSAYGLIKSEWKKENNQFILNVEIPANTTAAVYLPVKNSSLIVEGNKKISTVKDIHAIKNKDGKLILQIGSGSYKFTMPLK